MNKIIPCLWFDSNAEEAVNFYCTVFKNARVLKLAHYGPAGAKMSGRPEGSVMTVDFEIDGQRFTALNGGPIFQFNHAISLMVNCDSQAEIDQLWDRLGAGGKFEECGWLIDKYGLSWQIVPRVLEDMVTDDADQADRVMEALGKMKKLDINVLEQAARH